MFPERTTEFTVTVDLTADMAVINPFDFFVEPYAERFPFAYPEDMARDLAAYFEIDEDGPQLTKLVRQMEPAGRTTVDYLVFLNAEVQSRIAYVVRLEPGVQSPDETLGMGSGSCRDSAWLMVQMLRKLGLAARFVSGYLIQLKADIWTPPRASCAEKGTSPWRPHRITAPPPRSSGWPAPRPRNSTSRCR